MARFLLRRIVFGVFTLFVISLVVFLLFFMGGDPAPRFCGKVCTPDRLAVVRRRLHLDHSLYYQYTHYIGGVLHGDFGTSFVNQVPVTNTLRSGFPATASLALGAAVLWLAVSIPIGIGAATKPRSIRDRSTTLFALVGLSMPTFVVGLVLIDLLFYQLHTNHYVHTTFFPAAGYVPLKNPGQWAQHLILPWITLAFVTAATYSRLTRGAMLETLGEDYIRTARAKGLAERRVIYRHGLRSSLTPIVTLLGIDVGTLLGGTIVTEQLFGLNGIGQQTIRAQQNGDLPVVLGTVLVAAFFIVLANIIVDMLYAVLDPRVRLS